MMSIAWIFPGQGQGSFSVGMGKEFYETFPSAREVFQEVEDALHQNLTRLMFEGPEEELALTIHTQPAIMTLGIAIVRAFEKESTLSLKDCASYVAGHSLGEYTALCAAGSLSLTDTARLLRKRGEAMQKAVQPSEGAMAGFLGLDLQVVEELLKEIPEAFIANDNCPGQIVISGKKEAVEQASVQAQEVYKARRVVPLAVSVPSHCPLMEPAADLMNEAFEQVTFHSPAVPLISNVTALPVRGAEAIPSLLLDQLTQRVRWRESLEHLESLGVSGTLEIGWGKVLSQLVKRTTPELTPMTLTTLQELDDLLKFLQGKAYVA